MNTLEEKLLKKMANRHFKREMLSSLNSNVATLSSWLACINDSKWCNELAEKQLQKNLAMLELHILLLEKSYYPDIKQDRERIVQNIAKRYNIEVK